jgi:hypothetical protein
MTGNNVQHHHAALHVLMSDEQAHCYNNHYYEHDGSLYQYVIHACLLHRQVDGDVTSY